jgi:hypothetical protein
MYQHEHSLQVIMLNGLDQLLLIHLGGGQIADSGLLRFGLAAQVTECRTPSSGCGHPILGPAAEMPGPTAGIVALCSP